MSDPSLTRRPTATVGTFMPRELERLRTLSRLLDSAFVIPGTRYRLGLDAIVGLVPGIGDAISAVLSFYIIFQAARMGVPKATLARMMGNVGLDTIVGGIPLLGDLFDAGFKSNLRNVALIEQHIQRPASSRSQSRRVLLLLGIGLLAVFVGIIALGVVVAELVLRSI
jgi:Domain of unknown function (DUF4112)